MFDLESYWRFRGDRDKDESASSMIELSPNGSTEFVLVHSTRVILSVLVFCAKHIGEAGGGLSILDANPIFCKSPKFEDKMETIAHVSGMMLLMLFKLTNRAKDNFDPAVHF
jgi:hypothetical protein